MQQIIGVSFSVLSELCFIIVLSFFSIFDTVHSYSMLMLQRGCNSNDNVEFHVLYDSPPV